MHILVLGESGQLGATFRMYAEQFPHYTFSFLSSTDCNLLEIDSIAQKLSTYTFDVLINCAAYTAVDDADSEPHLAEEINHFAVVELAKFAASRALPLIHFSTDFVFDGKANAPYKEDATINPLSVYGKTKALGEEAIKNTPACNYTIIRTSRLYSPFRNNFLKTILALSKQKSTIHVVQDEISSPTNAEDLVTFILENLPMFAGKEILHYANTGSCSCYELAKTFLAMKGSDCTVTPILAKDYPSIATRPKFSVLDTQKIQTSYDRKIPEWRISLEKAAKNIN
jgi:dTDP-4-dehydrorhamnose reductase